jgi:sulfate/thiosulfate transport system ATP-binding protein
MAIEVRNISKSFGPTPVLEDINLDVQSGALTALLGPSGGGKSTLLRIIAGLETPDVGTVSILGQESTYLPPQRRNVGFVFQHYAAFKHLSVFRNVAFGLEVRKKNKDEIRKRVMELLELVHLDQFAERLPSQLSGGQRQRMALARALAVEPDVLLLDEPFGALDAQVRKELRAWLRRLHDEVHVTTVFVTHDQEEAIEISDDIVVLAGGKIIQSGAPAALYDHPANDFVMRFLGPVTELNGALVRPHDLELSLTSASDATPAVVRRIVKLGFEVRVDLQTQTGQEISAQLTRASSAQLDLAPGREVYVRLTAGARSLQLAG